MGKTAEDDERRAVLAVLDLDAIAPALDRTSSAIGRRTGLSAERALELLRGLAAERPTLVREMRADLWFRNIPLARAGG